MRFVYRGTVRTAASYPTSGAEVKYQSAGLPAISRRWQAELYCERESI
jgi:hypothetical protein